MNFINEGNRSGLCAERGAISQRYIYHLNWHGPFPGLDRVQSLKIPPVLLPFSQYTEYIFVAKVSGISQIYLEKARNIKEKTGEKNI